jgi:thioredoxin 1
MHTTQIIQLRGDGFDEATRDGLTLVDFWAPWCGPCRMQGAVLDELASTMGDSVRVAKVNVDEEPELAARFRVSAIPLLVLLKDGWELTRLVGYQQKVDIERTINGFKNLWNSQRKLK